MIHALARHYPEYLIEGALLGLFMLAACAAATLFEHPASPVRRSIQRPIYRRALVGLLMGLTAIALIYSPWGTRSGAHMNPATTLTFLVLGKIAPWDAAFYILAQFAGGTLGVALARLLARPFLAHPAVNHAATLPGPAGPRVAFLAECLIAFLLMSTVLHASNDAVLHPYTGLFAGALVALFITLEAPLSGMSMNPARTLASALPARAFRSLWIYFSAPPLAMLAAALLHLATHGPHAVYCAKLHHPDHGTCIFHCRIADMPHPANP